MSLQLNIVTMLPFGFNARSICEGRCKHVSIVKALQNVHFNNFLIKFSSGIVLPLTYYCVSLLIRKMHLWLFYLLKYIVCCLYFAVDI